MIRITQEQYDYLDKIWVNKFYAELFGYLSEHFSDYPEEKSRQLFDECNASCDKLRISTKEGIYAFHILSFMYGVPANHVREYMIAHRRYVLIGQGPDQLLIDIYDAMD